MGCSLRHGFILMVLITTALVSNRAAAARSEHVFALIVTNNKSTTLAQPDLQYADDDGARYFQLFRSVAAESDVALLTSFDRASANVYPGLVPAARAPTRSQIQVAVRNLRAAVLGARSHGEVTSFYFVFAGHGDVDDGRGYVELEDGRIDGRFIEQEVLDRIPADTKHLVLDSCNSFFVINPRKPGGRRWATPKDMAFGFSARHPEVGLFLSTNSDSEVFEWSAIESGVFSHEVRSGLAGAADINGDGSVSYSELAGFIETANSGIAREALRPHLFYRGPGGDSKAILFPTSATSGRRIALSSGPARYWVRTASGSRVLDVNKEAGAMTLLVPQSADEEFFVYEQRQDAARQKAPVVTERRIAPGPAAVDLALIKPESPAVAQRGERLFGSLFAKPFGPIAYARYLQTSAIEPEPVYGLTQADLSRMHNYLSAMAEQDRSNRTGYGFGLMSLGALAGSFGLGLALDKEDRHRYPTAIGVAGGLGVGLIGTGLYVTLSRSSGELALGTFEEELRRSAGNESRAFVRTEEWLTQMAARERTLRHTAFWIFEGSAVALATFATATALRPPSNGDNPYMGPALLYTEAVYFSAVGLLFGTTETATERMLKLYHEDPAVKLHVGPVGISGGLSLGLSGTF